MFAAIAHYKLHTWPYAVSKDLTKITDKLHRAGYKFAGRDVGNHCDIWECDAWGHTNKVHIYELDETESL